MYENLSDEQLLIAWERTWRMLSDLADGIAAPAYPEGLYRWYLAGEAELVRRGFVETGQGVWTRRAHSEPPSADAPATVTAKLSTVG